MESIEENKQGKRIMYMDTVKIKTSQTKNKNKLQSSKRKNGTPYAPGKSKLMGLLKSPAMIEAEHLQLSLGIESPSFIKVLIKANVGEFYRMFFPAPFCKIHLPLDKTTITLEDESARQFKAKYFPKMKGLCGGWRKFALQQKLSVGDVLLFHLVEPCKLKVYIIRDNDRTEVAVNNARQKQIEQVGEESPARKRPVTRRWSTAASKKQRVGPQDERAGNFKCSDNEMLEDEVASAALWALSETDNNERTNEVQVADDNSSITPCPFEHLWEGLTLGAELKRILRDYSRLDSTPFNDMAKMSIEPIRNATIQFLGDTLLQISEVPLEELELKALDELHKPFIDLEQYGVHCPYMKDRLAAAVQMKPSKCRDTISDLSAQLDSSAKELDVTLRRKEEIDQQLEALNETMQQLSDERDNALVRIDTLRNTIDEAKAAEAQKVDELLELLPSSDPIIVLSSTRNFLLPPP